MGNDMIKPGMFISDRYEIIDKVGSGGMADVYKAKCHRLNRYVAIKILKPEYSSDKNFVMKFRGEAQSAAGLSHPNIVSVYDVGDDDGLYYIVMELVEGITLKRFIERKGRLDIKEAVGIAIQIAQGMEAAHDNHIIHRDIKPQNIIISRDGKVKVADFGIAKAPSSNTVTQNAVGSVHYLSPEQARGGYSDERSDIYSLGVTLYEMLCGQVPFAGDNSVSVALSHIQNEATPISAINPNVPHSVDQIVQKCMQKKPERRYTSASELIHDLKKSIMNPEGDFVNLAQGAVTDSPTIHLTDEEMTTIKSAAISPKVYYKNPVKEPTPKKIRKEEEEELDSIDSRLEKVLIILSVIAAIALGVVIFFVVWKFIFDNNDQPAEDITPTVTVSGSLSPSPTPTNIPTPTGEPSDVLVTIPKVLSSTMEEAQATLKIISPNLDVIFEEGEYSDEYELGQVMKQTPQEGTQISDNGRVVLVLSAGPPPVKLPDVTDKQAEQAQAAIEAAAEFKVEIAYEYSETIAEGNVVRTDPVASEMIPKDSTVIMYVSLGRDMTPIAVPDIMGLTEAKAEKKLVEAGFVKGMVSNIPSTEYKKGRVCYQNYSGGEKVAPGTPIDISLSHGKNSGSEPTEEPIEPVEPVEPVVEPTVEPVEPVSEPVEPTPTPEASGGEGATGGDQPEDPVVINP